MTLPEHSSHDLIAAEIAGERALVVAPQIPEDAPPAVREGLARRRLVQTGAECPCGARMIPPNRAERRRARRVGRIIHVRAHHDAKCPALDENLAAAAAGLRR